MSDVKKRLDLLRKKRNPGPGLEKHRSCGVPDGTGVTDHPVPIESEAAAGKKATLEHLRSLITAAEDRSNRCNPLKPVPSMGLLSPEWYEGPGQSIEDCLPGEYLETRHGLCFRVRTEYPGYYFQGSTAVSDLLDRDPSLLKIVTGECGYDTLDYSKTLFFDTETTGLDTGAGVYIFLAGLGYFCDRRFIIEQYFMRDFPEEPAVLDALDTVMGRFDTVITYNGKTYDWPLLESRYAMNHRSVPIQQPLHLDLLHVTRKLFRHRLENCRLGSVETGVLGFSRIDDLPGALIPERYFRYIRSRDARHIHQAFAHNAHDILSMAALLTAILSFLDNPHAPGVQAQDLFSLGKLYEAGGEIMAAEKAYTAALTKGLNTELYQQALQSLSLIYKRNTDWVKACEIWKTMIQTAPGSGIFPYVELAKYHEHRSGNVDEAKKWVEAAFQRFPWLENDPQVLAALTHRLNRIINRWNAGTQKT